MRSDIQNIRSKVDKRQIVQYLLLRQRILDNKIVYPTTNSKESIESIKIRTKEIVKLIGMIKQDTIDNSIREMHQYIHKQNDYLKQLKKNSLDAIGETEKKE